MHHENICCRLVFELRNYAFSAFQSARESDLIMWVLVFISVFRWKRHSTNQQQHFQKSWGIHSFRKRNAQLMSENRYNAAFKNEILSHESTSIRAATCSCHSPFNKRFKFIVSIDDYAAHVLAGKFTHSLKLSGFPTNFEWNYPSSIISTVDCVHTGRKCLYTRWDRLKSSYAQTYWRDSGCFVYCVRCSFPLWIGCCESVAFSYQKSLRLNGTVFWIVLLHKFRSLDSRTSEACKQFECRQVFNVFQSWS